MLPPAAGHSSSPSSCKLEFRSTADDAWYAVRAVLRGNELILKYENFGDDHDDVFEPRSFSGLDELREFKARFRSLSRQLCDLECEQLAAGIVVCASHSFNDQDNRFYDAVVEDVNREKHSFSGGGGKEVCKCKFTVAWQNGPWKGCLASKRIENMCIVQPESQLVPAVLRFLKMARKEIEGACSKEAKGVEQSASRTQPAEVSSEVEGNRDDADLGGNPDCYASSVLLGERYASSDRYALLVDNLDIDIPPSALVHFIHQETSFSVEVHIQSSVLPRAFTSAVIVVNSGRQLEELCKFLDSPNQIAVSKSGRPLVVTEKKLSSDSVVTPTEKFIADGIASYKQGKSIGENDNGGLRVVRDGSIGYKCAKERKDLFIEFANHQRVMVQELAAMEKDIMESR